MFTQYVVRIEMLITGICPEGILSEADFVLDSIYLQAAPELAGVDLCCVLVERRSRGWPKMN